ncbi:Hypothetical predicted protein [Xyrichtys novacula]|uniref:Uncharacterized protein n=1 Tax=Xyrichtys novacula TaxID=13765 RepID=A0AAV1FP77_XYRNO|nr:Hypothetical predicted protein [Xyrichtys novacula]
MKRHAVKHLLQTGCMRIIRRSPASGQRCKSLSENRCVFTRFESVFLETFSLGNRLFLYFRLQSVTSQNNKDGVGLVESNCEGEEKKKSGEERTGGVSYD